MGEATIALLAALLGIAATNLFGLLHELKRRHTRETELVLAVHAEIVAGYTTLKTQTRPEESKRLLENEFPFGPSDRTDHVFDSIKHDLTSLPTEVIHEVIGYYKLASQSNLYTDDFRHPQYREQTTLERRDYRRNLLDILNAQAKAAERAVRKLEEVGASRGLDLTRKRRTELRIELLDERTNGT